MRFDRQVCTRVHCYTPIVLMSLTHKYLTVTYSTVRTLRIRRLQYSIEQNAHNPIWGHAFPHHFFPRQCQELIVRRGTRVVQGEKKNKCNIRRQGSDLLMCP